MSKKVTEPKPLAPHTAANMRDTFMTTHDKEYTRKSFGASLAEQAEDPANRTSGHINNRPIFGRPPTLDNSTTNGSHFQKWNRGADMNSLVPIACTPHEDRTAFVRERSIVGINWNESPTVSTMKASYTPKPVVAAGASAPFSGNGTRQFDPKFFHIASDPNEIDDVGRSKHKRSFGGDASRPQTQEQHPGVHPSRQYLLHTPLGPGSYFQHSRLIGDQSLAYSSQLPRGLQDSTEKHLLTQGGTLDKRTILAALAGRTNGKGAPGFFPERTNPIPMTTPEQETCRIGHRIENEGWVNGTTYRTFHTKQQLLPELPDPATGNKAAPMPPATAPLRDSRGVLVSNRPPHLANAVWNQMQLDEKATAVDKVAPHGHKMRTSVAVR